MRSVGAGPIIPAVSSSTLITLAGVAMLVYCVVCTAAAGVIGRRKSPRNGLGFYLIGFFFGLVGVLVAAVLPPAGYPAGWYPDPWRRGGARWWDGWRWTDEVSAEAAEVLDR